MANAESRHRRFKLLRPFRLRTLLVLLSLVAVLFGWQADRFHRRRQAIALLNSWELWVEEQEPAFDGLPWSLLPEWANGWLLPWRTTCSSVSDTVAACGTSSLGDPPDAVTENSVAPKNWKTLDATPAERKQLVAAIAVLRELPFVQVPFELDEDDLRTISGLTALETLGFRTCGLTSTGVAQIEKLPKMWRLFLDFDSPRCLPPKTITAMSKLPCLESLIINGPLGAEEAACLKAALPRTVVEVHVTSD